MINLEDIYNFNYVKNNDFFSRQKFFKQFFIRSF